MYILKKIRYILFILNRGGLVALRSKIFDYLQYHIYEKWMLLYFEIDLKDFCFSLPNMNNIIIRQARKEDICKIKLDIYPHLTDKQNFDMRYIDKIGTKDILCFVAEKNNKFVHYFMVFKSALESPLLQTPFKKSLLSQCDAFIGYIFTVPNSRGYWICPQVTLNILDYLKNHTNLKKVFLIVDDDILGARNFFTRIGFNEVLNVNSPSFILRWIRLIIVKFKGW
jgi:hypothetical protein